MLNIAHRGGALLWPENTLAAFRNALALPGCDGLEIDVQLSADGQAVIHHNYALRPDFTRDAAGDWLEAPGPRLAELSLAELQTFRIGRARPGSAYGESHPDLAGLDEPVPTLDAALELFAGAGPDGHLLLELKHPIREARARSDPERLVEAAAQALDRFELWDRTVVVGFNWRVLRMLRAIRPQARLWFTTYPASWFEPGQPPPEHKPPKPKTLKAYRRLYAAGAPWMDGFYPPAFDGSNGRAMKAGGADGWLVFGPDADDAALIEAKALGLRIGVWGVNDPADFARFRALGAAVLCTDRPDRFDEILTD